MLEKNKEIQSIRKAAQSKLNPNIFIAKILCQIYIVLNIGLLSLLDTLFVKQIRKVEAFLNLKNEYFYAFKILYFLLILTVVTHLRTPLYPIKVAELNERQVKGKELVNLVLEYYYCTTEY